MDSSLGTEKVFKSSISSSSTSKWGVAYGTEVYIYEEKTVQMRWDQLFPVKIAIRTVCQIRSPE